MSEIAILGTGLIYRNPKPHVHAIHAYFPSVVQLANGELLCSLVLGEAFDAANCHTYVARSTDQGRSWRLQGPIYPGTRIGSPRTPSRLTALPDGGAVAFMVRSDRTDHPDEGLANPENLGFVPTETLLLWSADAGHTWGLPEPLDPAAGGAILRAVLPDCAPARWPLVPAHLHLAGVGRRLPQRHEDGGVHFARRRAELARIPGRDARSGAKDHLLGIQDRASCPTGGCWRWRGSTTRSPGPICRTNTRSAPTAAIAGRRPHPPACKGRR